MFDLFSVRFGKSPLGRGAEARGGVGAYSIPYNPMDIAACSNNGAPHPVTQKKRDTPPRRGLSSIVSVIFAILLLTTTLIQAQNFRSPLGIPLYLSGSFGELRGAHFHSGMDIKTGGHTGEKVYAANDGYVSRIRVSAGGFGYALYIDHPNGYTTVYGHLMGYNATIDAFTKKCQYAKESFELDTILGPNVLPVKKGDVVALSGNTGSSGGPHLHFEVRRKKDQVPMNPQKMGFDLQDHIAPDITELYVYPLDSTLGDKPYSTKTVKVGSRYVLKDTLKLNASQVGFAVHVTDKMDNNPSIDDIYQLVLKVAGKTVYRFTLDSFSFDDTKYVQAHEDYKLKTFAKKTIQRLYRLPGNFIQVYDSLVNSGNVTLGTKPVQVEVIARDAAGNSSSLVFYVRKDANAKTFEPAIPVNKNATQLFKWNKENRYKNNGVEVVLAEKNLYRDMQFGCSIKPMASQKGAHSDLYNLGDDDEPIHKKMKVSIKTTDVPVQLKSKAVMANKNRNGSVDASEGTWKDNVFTADVKEFGVYYVTLDTVDPVIHPINIAEGKNMAKEKKLQVKIGDAVSGAKTYRGTIDGKWILMEFEGKSGMLTHVFENSLKAGEHVFKLVVTDRVNNVKELSLTFTR